MPTRPAHPATERSRNPRAGDETPASTRRRPTGDRPSHPAARAREAVQRASAGRSAGGASSGRARPFASLADEAVTHGLHVLSAEILSLGDTVAWLNAHRRADDCAKLAAALAPPLLRLKRLRDELSHERTAREAPRDSD